MFFMVFIHEILVYSRTGQEHQEDHRKVLTILRENSFYAKFLKYEFWLQQVSFSGHVLSKDEILVDSTKIEVVPKWECPIIVTEVQSFLGLAGYYQMFVQEFGRIASELTQLMRKGVTFEWNDGYEASFND